MFSEIGIQFKNRQHLLSGNELFLLLEILFLQIGYIKKLNCIPFQQPISRLLHVSRPQLLVLSLMPTKVSLSDSNPVQEVTYMIEKDINTGTNPFFLFIVLLFYSLLHQRDIQSHKT